MPWIAGDRSTSTSSRADSALTTEAPTPCRPPVATYEPPPNLPPACSLVKITSTPGRPVLGSLSTGMPRPSSWTSTEPSSCRVTSIRDAAPARASSTPLSMISHTQCMRPRVSVDPMYMPGRLRTASRPSRTRRWWALYVLSAIVVPPAVRVGMAQIYLRHAGRPDPPRLPPIRSGTVHDVPVDVTGLRTWGQAAVTMRQRRFQVLWIGNPEVPNRVRLGDEPVA